MEVNQDEVVIGRRIKVLLWFVMQEKAIRGGELLLENFFENYPKLKPKAFGLLY